MKLKQEIEKKEREKHMKTYQDYSNQLPSVNSSVLESLHATSTVNVNNNNNNNNNPINSTVDVVNNNNQYQQLSNFFIDNKYFTYSDCF